MRTKERKHISRYDITSNEKVDIKKIVVISDLHNKDFSWVKKVLIDEKPDLIFITGDLMNIRGFRKNNHSYSVRNQKNSVECLKFCPTIATTFMSIGNHECAINDLDSRYIICNHVCLLDNCYFKYKGLVIGGLTSGYLPDDERPDITKVIDYGPELSWLDNFEKENGMKVLLCHHPEYFPKYLKEKNIDLVVSGHAHGGQWRVFKQGIYSPGQGIFPKLTKGLYYNKRLLVSAGLANTAPNIPRIFNPLDFVVITVNEK